MMTGNFCDDDNCEINTGYTASEIKEAKRKLRISREMHYGGMVVSDDEYHEALKILGEE